MKRIKWLILYLAGAGLLLSACAGSQDGEVQRALDFRTSLLASEQCTYTADVTAEVGQRVYDFTLDCSYHPQDDHAELTVVAPDTIAGIAAAVEGETAQVSFEDTSLEFGTMAGGRIAPLQLPQLLGNAWTYGYVESQAKEQDGWLVTYRVGYGNDERLICTRFDEEMTPLQSEVYYDGSCVLTAEIKSYSVG